MFGFHKRSRSLIPVSELEKSEKEMLLTEEEIYIEEEEQDTEIEAEEVDFQTPAQRRNLTMIYLLFLAEAIMASSLSTQIMVLIPEATGCSSMNTSFLRSVLECAYFFGSATGMFWGSVADRWGRRKVALLGLAGMSTCCVSMGFAKSLSAFMALRFVAGAISSGVTVAGLAMLADATQGSSGRVKAVARLPVIAFGGSIGPFAANAMRKLGEEAKVDLFAKYPGLSAQAACGGLVLSITLAEMLLLRETLPQTTSKSIEREQYEDCEKSAFLGQSHANDSSDSLNISIIEALNDEAAPLPSRISITQLLSAPSVLLLLVSYAVLSLHSSTFDILLPHLGHTASHEGGLGIPCAWLSSVVMVVKVIAAIRILHFIPLIVNKVGLLPVYRRISMAFPVLYVLIPLLALAVNATGGAPLVSAVFNTVAMLAKTTLAGAAKVLVLLLVLSAAPDAASTGTTVGVVSISELFKALAVGVSGVSYYLSNDYSVVVVNGSLWAALAAIATIGAAMTWKVRETPRVGTDIPEECLVWQGMFDADSDEEAGF